MIRLFISILCRRVIADGRNLKLLFFWGPQKITITFSFFQRSLPNFQPAWALVRYNTYMNSDRIQAVCPCQFYVYPLKVLHNCPRFFFKFGGRSYMLQTSGYTKFELNQLKIEKQIPAISCTAMSHTARLATSFSLLTKSSKLSIQVSVEFWG